MSGVTGANKRELPANTPGNAVAWRLVPPTIVCPGIPGGFVFPGGGRIPTPLRAPLTPLGLRRPTRACRAWPVDFWDLGTSTPQVMLSPQMCCICHLCPVPLVSDPLCHDCYHPPLGLVCRISCFLQGTDQVAIVPVAILLPLGACVPWLPWRNWPPRRLTRHPA